MTGLERNADVVRMASYAPLFSNLEAWQWTPDLIWVDSLRVYATPNYYVQQLFARNRGDLVLPTQVQGVAESGTQIRRLYCSASRDEATGEVIVKVVTPTDVPTKAQLNLQGVAGVEPEAKVTVLASGDLDDVNSMPEPRKIAPVESKFSTVAPAFTYEFPAHAMTVLRIKTK